MAALPSTPQKLIAEALGTAFLVYVGAGSAAATGVIAAGTKAPFSMAELGIISFAFMLVIVGAVYAIGHISGGHINPAVTLSLAVTGKFPWREVPGYIGAQVVGAVAGAAARNQGDLATDRPAGPGDHLVLDVHRELRVRRGDAAQRVGDDRVWAVDELFHEVAPLSSSVAASVSGARLVIAASERTRPMKT